MDLKKTIYYIKSNNITSIDIRHEGIYTCHLRIDSSYKNNHINFYDDSGGSKRSIYLNKQTIKVVCISNAKGIIQVKSSKPIIIRIISIKKYEYSGNVGVYMHGCIGDLLLAAGYLQTFMDTNPDTTQYKIVHGGYHKPMAYHIFDREAKMFFGDIPTKTDKIIRRREAIRFLPAGLRNPFLFFGLNAYHNEISYPHLNPNSIVADFWTIPFWIKKYISRKRDSNTISIFRYSQNDQNKRSLLPKESLELLEGLHKKGYQINVIGFDDNLPVPSFCNNYIKKNSVLENIYLMSKSLCVLTIDSWPATIMPRIEVPTIIMENWHYSNYVKNVFHTYDNIYHVKRKSNWVEQIITLLGNIKLNVMI